MKPVITDWIRLDSRSVKRNGIKVLPDEAYSGKGPQDVYRAFSRNYMKFFKMDLLCKWAWLGAELLLQEEDKLLYEGIDNSKVAVVLLTNHGCIDVDKKYCETMSTIPSPALFVYTLPNIMLGEICIRHGFKGEQLCLVSEQFDAEELQFWVSDLLEKRGMEACLCGWADTYNDDKDICMFWISKNGEGIPFTINNLQQLYHEE